MSLLTDMEPLELTLQSTGVTQAPSNELVTFDPPALLARPHPLVIAAGTLHIWSFNLESAAATVAQCRDLLSPEERHRADRFVFDRDRIRHTVAHGVLRHLLSRYCGVTPESLRFATTAAGKPRLLDATEVHFNLTHSENRALLGVSSGRELGIDVERVRSNIEALSISRHYFFGTEREAIEAAAPAERDGVFFDYWVAKEAVLKAQGIGLGFPLDRFRVDFQADGRTARIESLDPAALAADWTIRMLPCESGWRAAVAARGTDWAVRLETLQGAGVLVTDPPDL